jgi:choline dehydrogenase-like flavoprotein
MQSFDFDAIVVGSGMTGGWAAKELTEKGLKVLVLERGKPLEHGKGYVTEHMEPWKIPFGGKYPRELYARDYPIQSTSYAFDETTRHFWNNDRENPYVFDEKKPFHWLRANVVGGKSLLWGRQVYRWSDLDFEANRRDGHGVDWPIRYGDIKEWYSYVEKFIGVSGQAENLAHLPDSEFMPPMQMNVVEKAVKQRIEAAYKDRRMTIGRVANLTEPLGERGACHYCGVCQRGCSVGAYFSSHSGTLPAATKTGRMTLRANSVVEGLDYDPATQRIAAVRVIDAVTKKKSRITARMDRGQPAGNAEFALGELPQRPRQPQRHARPLPDGSHELHRGYRRNRRVSRQILLRTASQRHQCAAFSQPGRPRCGRRFRARL